MRRQIVTACALSALSLSAADGGYVPTRAFAADPSESGSNAGVERRIPGEAEPKRVPPPDVDPGQVPPPRVVEDETFEWTVPVPDRWRLIETLGVHERWWDPYNQNTLKGDRPLFDDWFVNLLLISDTTLEPRSLPTPTQASGTGNAGTLDFFADNDQLVFNQNLLTSVSFIKGDTAYKPPDYEIRLTPIINYNYVEAEQAGFLQIDPQDGTTRSDGNVHLQEAFFDKHLRNVSDRYDFDSLRLGIQPITADFRGFLFQDEQFGARLFGTRDNNKWQYNAAWFHRLEKDTNSGLNDLKFRDDDVFLFNLYRQDIPVKGYTVQGVVAHNRNRDTEFHYNENGFLERPQSIGLERPREYDVTYLGFNGDGHFGRFNLSHSFYYAFGDNSANQFTSFFEDEPADIESFFVAVEPSIDFSWLRLRGSFLYASGDDDPFDDTETGFDAIFENPRFAGADTSYWIRQPVPLIGGGGAVLSGRNGVLNSLRSSKEEGQANFANPGIRLLGAGFDMDLTPEFRLSGNLNHLSFDETAVLEQLRMQPLSSREIGWDVSLAAIWRPLFTQNVVARLSGAALFPEDGFRELFPDQDVHYSVLFNLVLTY